jgi:hypothetical protein
MFRSLLLYTHSDSLSLIPFIFFYLSVCLYCSVASFLSYSFFFFFPLSFSAFFLLLLISCYCETIFQKHSKRNAHNTLSLETTTIGNKQHFISQKFFDGFFFLFKTFLFIFIFTFWEEDAPSHHSENLLLLLWRPFRFLFFFYPILWSNDVFYTVFYPLYTFPTTLYLWSQIFYYVLLNG